MNLVPRTRKLKQMPKEHRLEVALQVRGPVRMLWLQVSETPTDKA